MWFKSRTKPDRDGISHTLLNNRHVTCISKNVQYIMKLIIIIITDTEKIEHDQK